MGPDEQGVRSGVASAGPGDGATEVQDGAAGPGGRGRRHCQQQGRDGHVARRLCADCGSAWDQAWGQTPGRELPHVPRSRAASLSASQSPRERRGSPHTPCGVRVLPSAPSSRPHLGQRAGDANEAGKGRVRACARDLTLGRLTPTTVSGHATAQVETIPALPRASPPAVRLRAESPLSSRFLTGPPPPRLLLRAARKLHRKQPNCFSAPHGNASVQVRSVLVEGV